MNSGGIVGAIVGATIPILLTLWSIRDEVIAIRKRLDAAVKEESQ